MSFFGELSLSVILAATVLMFSGCSPSGYGQTNDDKEPHYVLGISRINAMDYTGAVEAFNEALEVNPHSAAAHFQLACLFDTKLSNPAAAIYHYQEYLRLKPNADNAAVIRQRIYSCKQQLAADVLPLPSAPAAQQQIEKLAEQNQQLKARIDHLNKVIQQWNVFYASLPNSVKHPLSGSSPGFAQTSAAGAMPHEVSPAASAMTHPVQSESAPRSTRTAAVRSATRKRTHVVKAGETMAAIAREFDVSLRALQAANPGVVPRKMRVGQVLNLP